MKLSIILAIVALTATHEIYANTETEIGPFDEEPPLPLGDIEEEGYDENDDEHELEPTDEGPFDEELEEDSYDEGIDTTAALTEAGLFEGDIQLSEEERETIYNGSSSLHPSDERNAINSRNKLWRSGVIPYVLARGYTSKQRQNIRRWLADFGKTRCIRAVPRTNQRDYVYVHSGGGCSSSVGRRSKGGRQTLSLARRGCIYRSTVLHEFMHAAGFWHEQSRADRDRYITVVLRNVRPKMRFNFNKVKMPTAKLIGSYDYNGHFQNKKTVWM